jgi:hypothetical protein
MNSKESSDCYSYGNYYVRDIPELIADEKISKIKVNYYHTVVFDFGGDYKGMRNEPDRYEYYQGEDKIPEVKYNTFNNKSGWIAFSFNCPTREKAEKIAQDKYYIFLQKYNETGSYHLAAKFIGATKI